MDVQTSECWNCNSDDLQLAGEFGMVCQSCGERQDEE